MKMPPRELRAGVLDDEPHLLPRPIQRQTDGKVYWRQGIACAPLGAGGQQQPALGSWAQAIRYWITFHPDKLPDLIISDIRFTKDESTPLRWGVRGEDEQEIPTGLSHAKPFAAVARALGKPMSIAMYTRAAEKWPELYAKSRARMSLLAAHEAGELAALLGEDLNVDAACDRATVERCWEWIADHTADNFEQGLQKAIRLYRIRFLELVGQIGKDFSRSSVLVLPDDWVRLEQWCKDMASNPTPLCSKDPGVQFVLPDGNPDCLFLHSLFADVWDSGTRDPELDPLPPSCFTVEEDATPCDLDPDGWPKIRAFVQRLRWLTTVSEDAADVLDKSFVPVEGPPTANLNETLRDNWPSYKQVRGLALLFQILRLEHRNFMKWNEAFSSYRWHVRPDEKHKEPYFESCHDGRSLQKVLKSLLRKCSTISERFTRADVVEEDAEWESEIIDDADVAWVAWHFQRLYEAGNLDYDATDDTYSVIDEDFKNPPIPTPAPPGVDWVNTHPKDSLGFKNDHAVQRVLWYAFGLADEKEGTEFLQQFVAGQSRPWLKELCRGYVKRALSWTQSETWPPSIRY